ncbi:MAG: hypothetical protein LC791_11020 [Acidobacteria bacterium]|nr:hypothetical protein [Acidobacteriota bacterium]
MRHSNHLWPGALAGAVAGIVMAAAMMGYVLVRQQSVWTNPNLIAVMWMGPKAATGGFGIATIVGFATHMAASVLMGVMGIPFIPALPRGAHRSGGVRVCSRLIPRGDCICDDVGNPLFVERTPVVPMTMPTSCSASSMDGRSSRLSDGQTGDRRIAGQLPESSVGDREP